MNRRRFLETSLAVPILGACKAPGEKSQLRGQTWNYPIDPLTEDEWKIVSLLQENLRRNNERTGDVLSTSNGPAEVQYCPDHWIDNELPKLYRDSVLRRIAGIQPMSGPTAIAWLRAPDNYYEDRLAEPLIPGQRHYISKNFQPFYVDDDGRLTSMEAVHDWRAMGMGVMPPFPVEKMAVCARSSVIENPDDTFSFLEKVIIQRWVGTAIAFQGLMRNLSWDILQFVPETKWVMCAPKDEDRVRRQSGIRPIITNLLIPGRAVIGFKSCEYHASFYVLPYTPLKVTRFVNQPNVQFKVCYGTASGTCPYYPRLWVAKV